MGVIAKLMLVNRGYLWGCSLWLLRRVFMCPCHRHKGLSRVRRYPNKGEHHARAADQRAVAAALLCACLALAVPLARAVDWPTVANQDALQHGEVGTQRGCFPAVADP